MSTGDTYSLPLSEPLTLLLLPPGADQASTGGLGGASPGWADPVSPAEAVKGSQQGLRQENSTQCGDGKTEAAWRLVQDLMVRGNGGWGLKLSDTGLEKGPQKLSEMERWNWARAQGIGQRETVPQAWIQDFQWAGAS